MTAALPERGGPIASASSAGFGHGKVILLGEHSVVFGQPALAAGMAAGVRAAVGPGMGRITVPDWGIDARWGDGSTVATALGRLLARLGRPGLDVDVTTEIPARAGLGSSAALSVAVARAAAPRNAAPAELLAAVAEAEAVFHGSASGIDAAAAFHGGVGRFRRTEGWQPLPLGQRFDLCVGLSGRSRDTKSQVETVGRLCDRTPAARRLVEVLGEVTEAGVRALADGDLSTLGRLFDVAHGLLAGLGVSSAPLDALVHGAREAGAMGAKLTGAGGGGAVIALAPGRGDEVLARWRALGFEGFVTTVGDAR